ncbi:dipeptide-binding ABC transporter [Klebsiella aerogenes]|nr:dipeptide-binding ABC transporter [Klebsiella aerogenes]
MARDLGADQIAALQDKPGVKVLSIPSAEQNYLVFNTANSTNPLLNNPAFWEAARWLVDYEGITKNLLKGQYFIHQSFLPAGLPGALETNPFTFDPQKAKAILDKAGIKDAHFTLDVENKPRLSPSPSRCRPALPGRGESGSAAGPPAARFMPGYARSSIRRRSACGSRTTLMRIPTPAPCLERW